MKEQKIVDWLVDYRDRLTEEEQNDYFSGGDCQECNEWNDGKRDLIKDLFSEIATGRFN